MLATYPDRTRAIYIAADWVWYYRFCQDKQRQQPLGPYGDLFDVDMGSVAVALKRLLENHKAELVADTRWAGAAWNSPDGMWTPLMRSAVMVRTSWVGRILCRGIFDSLRCCGLVRGQIIESRSSV